MIISVMQIVEKRLGYAGVIKGNDGIEGGFEDGNEDGIKGQTSLKVALMMA